MSLKCDDVSCGAGSIKGPSVKQYFREYTDIYLRPGLYPPVHRSNTWSVIPPGSTWSSDTVWCTTMIHSNLLGALFLSTTVHAHQLFSFTTISNKKLTLSSYWFGLNQVWPALYDFHSVQLGAFFWCPTVAIQTHRFTINVVLPGGWIVVAIETRRSDFFQIRLRCDIISQAYFYLLFNYEYSPMEISGVINLAGGCALCCCWSDWDENTLGIHCSFGLDRRAQLLLFNHHQTNLSCISVIAQLNLKTLDVTSLFIISPSCSHELLLLLFVLFSAT